jgi:hypothetical protein
MAFPTFGGHFLKTLFSILFPANGSSHSAGILDSTAFGDFSFQFREATAAAEFH